MAAGVDGLQLAILIFGLIQRFQTPSNFEGCFPAAQIFANVLLVICLVGGN
jgi:hypothetical protein